MEKHRKSLNIKIENYDLFADAESFYELVG